MALFGVAGAGLAGWEWTIGEAGTNIIPNNNANTTPKKTNAIQFVDLRELP
ncbi:MAG: hypothetical protein K8T91_06190 [Planctomycetes bacterium]|nr:hypothetical protein [Planctomycetota bacterium]